MKSEALNPRRIFAVDEPCKLGYAGHTVNWRLTPRVRHAAIMYLT